MSNINYQYDLNVNLFQKHFFPIKSQNVNVN